MSREEGRERRQPSDIPILEEVHGDLTMTEKEARIGQYADMDARDMPRPKCTGQTQRSRKRPGKPSLKT